MCIAQRCGVGQAEPCSWPLGWAGACVCFLTCCSGLPRVPCTAISPLVTNLCSALEKPLQRLELHTISPFHAFWETVRRDVQPAAVVLSTNSITVDWTPQLQHFTLLVLSNSQLDALNLSLEATPVQQLGQLQSLSLFDERSDAMRIDPSALPALTRLPALRKLVSWGRWEAACVPCIGPLADCLCDVIAAPITPPLLPALRIVQKCEGSVPESAWRCPHLTSILLGAVGIGPTMVSVASMEAAQCTSLLQLQLQDCPFLGTFPAGLCSALRQLSSLAVLDTHTSGLPPEFSLLR